MTDIKALIEQEGRHAEEMEDWDENEYGENDVFWSELFEEVQHNIQLGMNCRLLLKPDGIAEEQGWQGRWYYQIECDRPDAITGKMGTGRGGKAYLSPNMTRSELVQVAFGLYKAYWEHEARETFRYAEEQVFGPHFDVTLLHHLARMGGEEYRDGDRTG